MITFSDSGNFVKTHDLQRGDFIMVYQDDNDQNYVIQGRKATGEDDRVRYMDAGNSSTHEIFPFADYELAGAPFGYDYCPNILDDYGRGMSFVYDTTFSRDTPLDFLGGPMTHFSRFGPPENFGSVENISLDDFY
ncbi:hypothetical protein SAY86_016672 [Trapa natans]|uniref:Uncharacterized protein n=1 Tax=Trapa natans TaxID=22666 RepID=A0AAN7R032_TRANT|nr:hypothetical protein SAY86_016672 [Trapa natans]